MSEPAHPKGFLKQFPFAFWLINGIELLERGAYYGMLAVLPVYLVVRRGMPAEEAGLLFSVLLPLLYFVPVLAAPFAEKFGYRAALAACFLVLAPGYALLAVMNEFYGFLLCTILIGVGAGIFKPIAAALVGQTTREEQRNFGYAIYYWAINIGAFFTPLAIGLFLPRDLFVVAFYISAAMIAANLLIVFTIFRNVNPPQREKDVWAAIKGLGAIRHEPRFLVLLLIYAGFWFMYGVSLTYLSVYMVEFNVMPAWFNEAFLATLNPGTIILTGLVTGKLTEKLPSLWLMTAGIAGFVAGFVVLGFTALPFLFIGGVILYSASEFLVQPSFLSYTSKIAPPDKLSIWIGYGFVPIGVGFLGSGIGGGYLYGHFARDLGQPGMFWSVVAAVGLLTVAALTTYNHVIAGKLARSTPAPRRRSIAGPVIAVLALLAAPALIGAAAVTGGPVAAAASDDEADAHSLVELAPLDGALAAGESATHTVTVPANARANATFVLRWTDEAATGPVQNPPDSFELRVTPPGAARAEVVAGSNPPGGEGAITIVVPELPQGLAGNWAVEIVLTTVGSPSAGPLGIPVAQDAGNAWRLETAFEA